MTRNLYLGADLTPALEANTIDKAVDAAYKIEQQVHVTQFPTIRSTLLANEIRKKKPDVVGLQEAAWWRTGPYDLGAVTSGPKATQTDPGGGDFLSDLLAKLNTKGKKAALRYKIARRWEQEFDFELPVNQGTGGLSACPSQCHNERLTMRDAILVRKNAGIKLSNAQGGHFNTLLRVTVGGVLPVDVTRGWAAVDVKKNGRKVHVVDSHLEAFDSAASNSGSDGKTYAKGGIREAQANELIGPNGPATSKLPTLLIGDFNSDFPVHGDQVLPGDALAYLALRAGGLSERALKPPPFGCCIQDPNLTNPSAAGITHRVDHIMTRSKRIKFKKGALTSTYKHGLWSSDHFGVFSQLLIK